MRFLIALNGFRHAGLLRILMFQLREEEQFFTLCVVSAQVCADSKEPWFERIRNIKLRQVFVKSNECLLCDILGIGLIAREPSGVAVNGRTIVLNKRPKSLAVSCNGLLCKLCIGKLFRGRHVDSIVLPYTTGGEESFNMIYKILLGALDFTLCRPDQFSKIKELEGQRMHHC